MPRYPFERVNGLLDDGIGPNLASRIEASDDDKPANAVCGSSAFDSTGTSIAPFFAVSGAENTLGREPSAQW
jgi:hypothetical protein